MASKPNSLYVLEWSNGTLSIDLVKHHDEMPKVDHLSAPSANAHTSLTDMLILKWYDTHGSESAWDIAIHLGGEVHGYTDAWVVQRYMYILDQIYGSGDEEAIPSPLFMLDATHSTEMDPDKPSVTPTPPPTEVSETRPPTPEKLKLEKPINPSGRRKWTHEADERIREWVSKHGQSWRALARYMGGRMFGYSDDAVRNRYMRINGIKSTKGRFVRATPIRGPKWSADEDAIISNLYDISHHNRWVNIAAKLGTCRTPAAIRLRAQRLGLFEYADKP